MSRTGTSILVGVLLGRAVAALYAVTGASIASGGAPLPSRAAIMAQVPAMPGAVIALVALGWALSGFVAALAGRAMGGSVRTAWASAAVLAAWNALGFAGVAAPAALVVACLLAPFAGAALAAPIPLPRRAAA